MFKAMIKARNKKGFTLMEMLIVVAIIAILVAVSIPVFTNQLEKAKKATDDANARSAKAVAIAAFLTEDTEDFDPDDDGSFTANYDAANGVLTSDTPEGYGKSSDNLDKYITVDVDGDGAATIEWAGGDD